MSRNSFDGSYRSDPVIRAGASWVAHGLLQKPCVTQCLLSGLMVLNRCSARNTRWTTAASRRRRAS
ncbi:hypothetical protein BN2475_700002 [Paraburkholderia ribeironis]|uniref:Uncharacterized protein n=1 Tax=Paraburkholderia ribeironis TaxID=1247936 RepID=A0A1N7SHF3_9BURK|nr:hypothetical protein BN2475_700002 [Paraburkholderia ribeironis]